MTATEEKLATFSMPTHEAPPLNDQSTRFTLPPQSEEIPSRDTYPSADFGGLLDIEEQVSARLAERHRGASTGYLPSTDKDSGQDDPPQVPDEVRGKV